MHHVQTHVCLGLQVIYLMHQFTGQKLTLRELRESTTLDFLVSGKQKVKLGVDKVLLCREFTQLTSALSCAISVLK